ncbi:MAG: tetratricopeptide repeat protein, partial [Gemmatimonadales bacterium]
MAIGSVLILVVLAGPAWGQLAVSRSSERVLFLAPRPQSDVDTSYVVELAERVRRRMSTELRHKLVVIDDDQICQALEASGYPCDAILNAGDADRLARFLQADAYAFGSVWEEQSRPMARFRLVDLRSSGLSGWMTVRGIPGDPPQAFAETIVDSLENQVRAAEHARECLQRRDRGDFDDALERAQRAYRMYPNHPSAAQCAWVVSEALRQPIDSQVRHLQRFVAGDSLNARAWQRLGQALSQQGDSLAALDAFVHQTLLLPNDRERRVGVLLGAVSLGEFDTAVRLADEWMEQNPLDVEMVRTKLGACVQGEM